MKIIFHFSPFAEFFIREEDEDQSKYPISKHPSSFIEKSRRKHLVDAVTAAVAARKKDEKEDTKNKPTGNTNEGIKISFIRSLNCDNQLESYISLIHNI